MAAPSNFPAQRIIRFINKRDDNRCRDRSMGIFVTHSLGKFVVGGIQVFLRYTVDRFISVADQGCLHCRKIPRSTQVFAAQDYLGRRGDLVLLQGEVQERPQGLVRHQSLPFAARETRAGGKHRSHHHTGQQLVQEQEAEGSSCWA